MPEFGFKAKPAAALMAAAVQCSMPEFGFKAKPACYDTVLGEKCSMPDLDLIAKRLLRIPRCAVSGVCMSHKMLSRVLKRQRVSHHGVIRYACELEGVPE